MEQLLSEPQYCADPSAAAAKLLLLRKVEQLQQVSKPSAACTAPPGRIPLPQKLLQLPMLLLLVLGGKRRG